MAITNTPTFGFSKPSVLFDGATLPDFFEVSADGQKFLVAQPVEPARPPTEINVLLNWFENLNPKADLP